MNQHQRATDLFDACCEMNGTEREGYLEAQCGADQELRKLVQRMLAFDERRPEFLAGNASDALNPSAGDLPQSLGPFRIRGLLGEGGMGAVYEAEQESPLRTVALKVLHPFFRKQHDCFQVASQHA